MESPRQTRGPAGSAGSTGVMSPGLTYLLGIAAAVVVIAGMRAAKPLIVPFLLAVFISVLCVPAVSWLTARRMPRGLSVAVVLLLVIGLFVGAGALLGTSVGQFSDSLPKYQQRLQEILGTVIKWLGKLGIKGSGKKALEALDLGAAMSLVGGTLKSLASMLSNLVVVLLTVIFVLLEATGFPGKLRAAMGDPNADLSHFERMAGEVKRYLAIKTFISLITGVLAGVWCAVLGVDFAILWALTAFLFNYIPNLGSILAAIPPCLLAIIQFGLGRSLVLGAGYVAINMVLGNVLEPMWMGRKLGLSTLVVFISLIFWGWVLGPTGMLLSVPLTMVVKIAMEHSERYKHVAVLLDVAPPASTTAKGQSKERVDKGMVEKEMVEKETSVSKKDPDPDLKPDAQPEPDAELNAGSIPDAGPPEGDPKPE